MFEGRRHRSGRSSRQSRPTRGRSRRANGDLSVHARCVRTDDPGNLRHRARARRPGFHGWSKHECPMWSMSPWRLRRGCLSFEFAQDLLHSARRRRTGRRADRRGKHLAPYLPREFILDPTTGKIVFGEGERGKRPPHGNGSAPRHGGGKGGNVAAAPYGSASILTITWMYIQMMGADGLKRARSEERRVGKEGRCPWWRER